MHRHAHIIGSQKQKKMHREKTPFGQQDYSQLLFLSLCISTSKMSEQLQWKMKTQAPTVETVTSIFFFRLSRERMKS